MGATDVNGGPALPDVGVADVGAYCRRVEAHLTRANGGHLVRIVGPAFELVRGWAERGVPLSVVTHAIDAKAERHREGHARQPLRIEHCEREVRAVFDHWRRAIGVTALSADAVEAAADAPSGEADAADDRRRPSLSKHFERVIDRLSRAAGRDDAPDALRDAMTRILAEVTALRDATRGARGPAREEAIAQLQAIDVRLAADAAAATPPDVAAAVRADALDELAPYRRVLQAAAWESGLRATEDRLLRERFGLPLIELR